MESGKERKVCFIASSGGHWEELMCLKSVAQKYDSFYVTEEGGQANDASANLDKIYERGKRCYSCSWKSSLYLRFAEERSEGYCNHAVCCGASHVL